jgi:hypothetical protein
MPRPRSADRPKTKAAAQMDARYVGWSSRRRMEEAVRLVRDHGLSQSEAARRCGVTRARLNEHIQSHRKIAEEHAQRSEDARRERVEAFDRAQNASFTPESSVLGPVVQVSPPIVLDGASEAVISVTNERRRIPPAAEFQRMYFGKVICPDCGVHHEVPDFHDEMLTKITDPAVRRLLINVAPYHAKSTVGSVYSTVYEICRDPNSRTAIVSKAERLAKNFLYQIKKFLTDPMVYGDGPNLIEDWGPFYNQNQWSNTEIYVAGRQSPEKDPTVSVFGVGALIYGYRFDRMIFDDIADLENQRNPDRVAEQLQWTTQECASRVGKTGKLIFVGTRISPGDIYSYLKQLPAFEVITYPVIKDEQTREMLWGEHFPYVSADEQRNSMTIEQFQLVYQNVDTLGAGAAFPYEVVARAEDVERSLGHYEPEWQLVLGVDPAGAGEQAGFTAMVVLGVDIQTGRRYLVDMVNHKQMRAPQIKDQIIDFAAKYPLRQIRVEVNGLQSQLFQYDQELIMKLTNAGVRFVPHITARNKWDPQFGVESMGTMFYNQQFSSPWGDINSRKKVGQLHEQLTQFPMGTVSDLVMALWFAELGVRDLYQTAKLPAFDSRMHVPARIRRGRHVVDFGQGMVRQPEEHELYDPLNPPQQRQMVNVSGSVSIY